MYEARTALSYLEPENPGCEEKRRRKFCLADMRTTQHRGSALKRVVQPSPGQIRLVLLSYNVVLLPKLLHDLKYFKLI